MPLAGFQRVLQPLAGRQTYMHSYRYEYTVKSMYMYRYRCKCSEAALPPVPVQPNTAALAYNMLPITQKLMTVLLGI
eukprot:scaffold166126_cov27-Tisochrysis_lutea.AAC.3